MKKLFSLLLAAIMVVSMAACGASDAPETTEAPAPSGDNSAESTAPAAEKSDVELTYWSMWNSTEGQAKIITEAAEAYEAATGIHINLEFKGREVAQLIGPALDAGQDIDFFDTDYMKLVQENGKYLADLTDMAAAADYERHILPILTNNAKEWGDGVLKVMPYQPFTTGVWYNKAIFEQAGVADAVPATFNELLDLCEKIKATGINPMTCNSDGVTLLYGYQCARYIGQDALNELRDNPAKWADSAEAKKAAADIQSLFAKGYMSEYAPANYPDGQNEIGFGESAMILNASWIPNEINQNTGATVEWGFFPWPAVEGGADGIEASMVGSQGFGIVDKSEHKQEAFDFILSIVTGENDVKMAQAVTAIPADVENTEWPAAVSGAEPYFKNMTKTYLWAVGLEANSNYKDFYQDLLIQLCKQEIDVDTFIQEMSAIK